MKVDVGIGVSVKLCDILKKTSIQIGRHIAEWCLVQRGDEPSRSVGAARNDNRVCHSDVLYPVYCTKVVFENDRLKWVRAGL